MPSQGLVAHSRADLYRAGPVCKRAPGWGSALQRAWIIALIGLACFGFLGRHK